jgi:hypothetical protein
MVFKRFFRFFRYFCIHYLHDVFIYNGESCARCGRLYKVWFLTDDKTWNDVISNSPFEYKTLCIDCFLSLAEKKNKKNKFKKNKILLLTEAKK